MPQLSRIDHPNLTSARKRMLTRRLLKLRGILADAPPEHYDHCTIMEQGELVQERRGCGTAACAVGHAVLHHREFPGLKVDIIRDEFGWVEGDLECVHPPKWMQDIADADGQDLHPSSDYYFGPYAWNYIFSTCAYRKAAENVTKFDAIQRIEDYITQVLGCELVPIDEPETATAR